MFKVGERTFQIGELTIFKFVFSNFDKNLIALILSLDYLNFLKNNLGNQVCLKE